jgi:hypothetical protein
MQSIIADSFYSVTQNREMQLPLDMLEMRN